MWAWNYQIPLISSNFSFFHSSSKSEEGGNVDNLNYKVSTSTTETLEIIPKDKVPCQSSNSSQLEPWYFTQKKNQQHSGQLRRTTALITSHLYEAEYPGEKSVH